MSIRIGFALGPSFSEIVATDDQLQLLSEARFYHSFDPPNLALKKVIQQLTDDKILTEKNPIKSIVITNSLLDKIMDTKLGGSVAQVVTSGFEHWALIRQPSKQKQYDLSPTRAEALASKELIFGLSERITQDGKVLQSIKNEELEMIDSKLKLMGITKVCINLIFANKNPSHQILATEFFKKQGYEVFSIHRNKDSDDEVPAWRINLLNACLFGSFTEIHESFIALGIDKNVIFYTDQYGKPQMMDSNLISSFHYSWLTHFSDISRFSTAKGKSKQNIDADILYLGLEKWSLISSTRRSRYQKTAWGPIEMNLPENKRISIQPTMELGAGLHSPFAITSIEKGFEPGPMSFGRSAVPLVSDIMLSLFPSAQLARYRNQSGLNKFKDYLITQTKAHPELNHLNEAQLQQEMMQMILNLITQEAELFSTKKILITGFWAQTLGPLLTELTDQFIYEKSSNDCMEALMCIKATI